jgi:hypothetical protein
MAKQRTDTAQVPILDVTHCLESQFKTENKGLAGLASPLHGEEYPFRNQVLRFGGGLQKRTG